MAGKNELKKQMGSARFLITMSSTSLEGYRLACKLMSMRKSIEIPFLEKKYLFSSSPTFSFLPRVEDCKSGGGLFSSKSIEMTKTKEEEDYKQEQTKFEEKKFTIMEVDEDGTKVWILGDKYHRVNAPAVIRTDGYKAWFFEGKFHRVDGPAIENANGDKAWYFKGKKHRVGGPAVENANGDKEWWVEGKCHRVDGPAIEYSDGYKSWFFEGKLQKIDWQAGQARPS